MNSPTNESTTVNPAGAARLRSTDAASGALLAEWPVDDDAAVAAAVERARFAAAHWREIGFGGRRKALLRWASYLVRNADEILELIHRENGKPRDDAYLELMLVLEHLNWAARNAGKVLASRRVFPGPLMANHQAVVEQRPLGVVGVIGPWNYPIYTPNGSIAYALAAGNAVVFKPSEHTTSVGVWYAESFHRANPDLPWVLSYVTGFGQTGAALVRSGVDKIAFTGSTPTGRKIMGAAAEQLTPVLLECGGKDAAIVACDADIAAAADGIAWSAMSNGGQTCVGTERVYVERPVYDHFLAELQARLAGVRPGSEKGAAYGPMTMPNQIDVVREHIADALDRGGRAIVGGLDSVGAACIEPVVLIDTPEDSLAVVEETFGPTVTVTAVDSIETAIKYANSSQYGLAGTVYSRRYGMQIARRLRAGATSVNSVLAFAAVAALPFGGVGASGIGRIHGAEGLREFSRPQSIARQRFPLPGLALLSFRRRPLTLALIKRLIRLRHGHHH